MQSYCAFKEILAVWWECNTDELRILSNGEKDILRISSIPQIDFPSRKESLWSGCFHTTESSIQNRQYDPE